MRLPFPVLSCSLSCALRLSSDCFRSMSIGSKQQDLHPAMIARFPVPICSAASVNELARWSRHASVSCDDADSEAEDQALALLESTIEEAA